MKGDLLVDSSVGQGSVFHFSVRMPLAAGEAVPSPAPGEPLAGRRALVVDDYAPARQSMIDLLAAMGCASVRRPGRWERDAGAVCRRRHAGA